MPSNEFGLLDIQEQFLAAAASCSKSCKLLSQWNLKLDADGKTFEVLTDVYQSSLPEGDFGNVEHVGKSG